MKGKAVKETLQLRCTCLNMENKFFKTRRDNSSYHTFNYSQCKKGMWEGIMTRKHCVAKQSSSSEPRVTLCRDTGLSPIRWCLLGLQKSLSPERRSGIQCPDGFFPAEKTEDTAHPHFPSGYIDQKVEDKVSPSFPAWIHGS